MALSKSSKLNPLAISFFPGLTPDINQIRSIAEKSLRKLVQQKEARGEHSLTKEEMADIVGNLISMKFDIKDDADKGRLNSYISDKIMKAEIPALKAKLNPRPLLPRSTCLFQGFDKVVLPCTTFLIAAFWGLHRHEQAQIPLLSLTKRPDIVKDKVWSIDSSDKQLWNPRVVIETCSCPPVFGYTIPAEFFGNILNCNSCSVRKIHLNHYNESREGNEHILSCIFRPNMMEDIDVLETMEDYKPSSVCELKEYFQSIVEDICGILEKQSENSTECQITEVETDEEELSFWDSETDFKYHTSTPKEELIDDGNHPLLENPCFMEDEGISSEIEEIIRKSFSPKKTLDWNPIEDLPEEVGYQEKMCDPPCSIWCSANNGSKDPTGPSKDPAVHVEIQITPPDTEVPAEVVTTDLVSPAQLNSQENAKEKFIFTQVLDLVGPKKRPSYKRSFSVNDCDPCYYEAKFGLNGAKEQGFNQMSSKDMLVFLRKDPVNFFKTFKRKDSWKDSDSGFLSHWSSQEDFMTEQFHEDKGHMWGVFSGEDSLWKPLPECETPTGNAESAKLRKPGNDMKRQKSVT